MEVSRVYILALCLILEEKLSLLSMILAVGAMLFDYSAHLLFCWRLNPEPKPLFYHAMLSLRSPHPFLHVCLPASFQAAEERSGSVLSLVTVSLGLYSGSGEINSRFVVISV